MACDLPVGPGIIPSYPQFLSVFISFPQGLFNPTRDEEGVEDNGWTAGRSGQVWNWMLCDKARSH